MIMWWKKEVDTAPELVGTRLTKLIVVKGFSHEKTLVIWFCTYKDEVWPPSSHCRHHSVIFLTVNCDTRINLRNECTRVMSILLLTHPHILEYFFCHFDTRNFLNHFRVKSASSPIRTSTDQKKGESASDVLFRSPNNSSFSTFLSRR